MLLAEIKIYSNIRSNNEQTAGSILIYELPVPLDALRIEVGGRLVQQVERVARVLLPQLFRELHAPDAQQAIALHHLAGRELDLHNLLTDETSTARVSDCGKLTLNIPDPADYRFLAYRVRRRPGGTRPTDEAQA